MVLVGSRLLSARARGAYVASAPAPTVYGAPMTHSRKPRTAFPVSTNVTDDGRCHGPDRSSTLQLTRGGWYAPTVELGIPMLHHSHVETGMLRDDHIYIYIYIYRNSYILSDFKTAHRAQS